jgi:lauroyl-KDO2-lipid IV(A) myristoyltransferase
LGYRLRFDTAQTLTTGHKTQACANLGKVYERSAGLKPIIKDMRNGYHFFYLPDQDHGHDACIFVPLFGVPKATLPALPKLTKLAGAVVLPVLATYNEKNIPV